MKKLLFTTLLLIGAASAQKATTVRLGYFPNVTHAAALVGLEKGYFQKELGNVKLSAKEFVAGTALNEAFAAGEIDIGFIGPGPAINGAVRGLPVQIIAGASNAGAVLVARKGTGIKSYKDLAGKKVAVPTLGNTQDISLRHILKEEGLTGKVTIQPLAPADVAAAFAAKQLDAALVPEPWGAVLENRGGTLVGNEKTVWRNGDYPTTLVIVNTKFAQENPELVKAFLRGHIKAVNFIKSNGPAAQASISRELLKLTKEKVDPRVLQRALKRTEITTSFNLDALKEYADLNKEAGFIRTLPDWNTLINPSYLNEVK
ncbi:ABC transporter substrate-binding protein [Deinococcus cellulosilyticus]|uniref:ABC transporter substrate-binding protein n=1 Tax=Deinococcus cellulosilyticus (strain DSM 18568 / NBRC 106333 / KACC 11606 / 5516J-15) TaxID=1223518 RepID=A0A511MZ67_DEIC1|nr:ABC transporter substrate-binding protein [Deinococcus cellulosilyticus]GEM45437.1 ABC transporter substrate-binding protein [Deinococcus cellulosilyticus NBRC 106333 = KACC 11606]